MPSSIPSEMILASAGSGKTYQLTNRYLSLMALQRRSGLEVGPERIIALTFTRKAAGEFFDSILLKLAEGAVTPGYGTRLAGEGDDLLSEALRSLDERDFLELLRLFIRRMPRLFLGTLDSFFSSILRSFPAEFGIAGEFEVMDDYRSAGARDLVYGTVFSRRNARAEAHRSDFLESFRLATFGKESAKIIGEFDRFVEDLHGLYLEAPDAAKWGRREAVWGARRSPFFDDAEIEVETEFDRLFATFDAVSDRVVHARWEAFREAVGEHRHGAAFAAPIKYILERVLPHLSELEAGGAEIKFERKVHPFDPVACEALLRVVRWLVGGLLEAKMRRTRGIWELLDLYETTYSEKVRREGQLTFQDMLLLLAGHGPGGVGPGDDGGVSATLLSQAPSEADRLQIDYRLDARYDHWLLDEFQDTSRMQWRVIENLIDEIVQDTSGTRSLFQVGDVKQAIYGWRGGDSRLFADLRDRYNRHEERLRQRSLDVSYRSVADVLEPVNALFGDRAALAALEIPEAALDRWQWNDHRVGAPLEGKAGYTALLNPLPADGAGAPGDEDLYDLVLGILDEVRPHRRGLSCAILVRSNASGKAIVEHLRARSAIPVVSESDRHIALDNPLGLALLSLFQLAAHPGDRFAWEHLRLSPYRRRIEAEALGRHALSRDLARQVYEDGFEATARRAAEVFAAGCEEPFDAFTRERLDAFLLAARLFEEHGSRDIDDFLLHLRKRTERETADAGSVQVMTYHKAKGLTFDLVILPDLKSNSLSTPDLGIGAREDADRRVRWVLDLPTRDILEADPVLAEYVVEKQAEAAYEALCRYYVGLTRAKYANYLLALPQPAKSTSKNFVKLLQDVLGGDPQPVEFGGVAAESLYESRTAWTSREWFEAWPLGAGQDEDGEEAAEADASAPAPLPPGDVPLPAPRVRPRRRTPSGSEKGEVSAAQVFARHGGGAREFGNLVHAIFEDIEWHPGGPLSGLRAAWAEDSRALGAEPGLVDEAFAEVERALAAPEVAALFAQKSNAESDAGAPSATREVWRERRFEILIGDEWLSGVFDRVVIERGPSGEPLAATVIDFKTDRVASAGAEDLAASVAKYRPQLETYREVLARMTGLEPASIGLALVFTRAPTVARW